MKSQLIAIVAAVLVVGCGESKQLPPPQAEPVEPAMPEQEILAAIKELETMVAVAEAATPEPPSTKAQDIAIRKAVEAGNIEAVKPAIADGADVDSKNVEGRTPLCRAVQYGKKDVIKLLIEEGADVNARMNFGDTALDYANVSGGLGMSYEVQKEVVDLLRKHGGKTGEELKAEGKISIHEAAEDGNIEAVKQHLAAGTKVDAKGGGDYTPLHVAAYRGHKDIAELLIAKGADVNVKNIVGETPLDLAILDKHTELADLLRKHGGKTGKELKAEGK